MKAWKRRRYYAGKGEAPPLPIPYRTALAPIKSKYFAVRARVITVRIVAILNEQEPLTRAAYILLYLYGYDPEEVSDYLKEPIENLQQRAAEVKKKVDATEHQNYYKDWELVQHLIDEGVDVMDVREMIGISQPGWDAARRRGDVRI